MQYKLEHTSKMMHATASVKNQKSLLSALPACLKSGNLHLLPLHQAHFHIRISPHVLTYVLPCQQLAGPLVQHLSQVIQRSLYYTSSSSACLSSAIIHDGHKAEADHGHRPEESW